jgi:hypothetical protein
MAKRTTLGKRLSEVPVQQRNAIRDENSN